MHSQDYSKGLSQYEGEVYSLKKNLDEVGVACILALVRLCQADVTGFIGGAAAPAATVAADCVVAHRVQLRP